MQYLSYVCLPYWYSLVQRLSQRLKQRLGLLEIGRVKALVEPAVDRRQQCMRLGPLALLLPQARQTRRRPQLPRLGLLATGNGEGLLEAGFRLGRIWGGLAQEEFALEPIRLRQQVTLPACLRRRKHLGQQA